jgi:hypothetical protein
MDDVTRKLIKDVLTNWKYVTFAVGFGLFAALVTYLVVKAAV